MSPAPSRIIIFTDADGDEFPVRIFGMYATTGGETKAAHQMIQQHIADGISRPTMPIKITERKSA